MKVAIITGSGFDDLRGIARMAGVEKSTPYGDASAYPGVVDGDADVLVLARHGQPHRIAPGDINYRANLWLLHSLGVTSVLALNTVGGMDEGLEPGDFAVPRQLIDYTWGRASTFSDDQRLLHVDFSEPYTAALREALLRAVPATTTVRDGGVYACTQGPRLETAAEVERMCRDGATLVGMTGMPEAVLARELEIEYAALALVVNPAAGRGGQRIIDHQAMNAVLESARDAMFDIALEAARNLVTGAWRDQNCT